MIIGLSVALGLFGIELIGFIGGISMFLPMQSMLCILLKLRTGTCMYYKTTLVLKVKTEIFASMVG